MFLYMDTTQKIIATNLKRLMQKHRLTQTMLAKKTGLSQKPFLTSLIWIMTAMLRHKVLKKLQNILTFRLTKS